jgi:hypothetical protein
MINPNDQTYKIYNLTQKTEIYENLKSKRYSFGSIVLLTDIDD